MMNIFGFLKEACGLAKILADPKNKKAAYELHIKKRTRVALEMAEKAFLIWKEYKYIRNDKERKRLSTRVDYYMRKFFDYN